MKTNKEIAADVVKITLGIVALMRPRTSEEFTAAQQIAEKLVETTINDHVQSLINGGEEAAKKWMEGK